ncbi:MAG TPA: protein translocase subunit SecD, partial [Acidimicrobiales bacterium]|nr:protein translocase subunit SecD [Acidimicrobiales bacterium]
MRGRLWAWLVGTILVSLASFGAVMALGAKPLLGLDLQGGVSVVYKPAHPVKPDILDQTISIIRNRVDALGVAEPNIGRSGGNISVQLPGVKDRAKALAIIGQTAQLRFRPVLCTVPPFHPAKPTPKGQPPPTLNGPPPPCPGAKGSPNFATVANTPRRLDKPGDRVLLPARAGSNGTVPERYVLGPSQATGRIIKTANAALNPQTSTWQVNFSTTPKGAAAWDKVAKANFHKQLAIALDGTVESAPQIQPNQASFSSFGGNGQITGHFTQSQANSLALELRYGSLPVQLVQQSVQSVSPTLGASALKAGLFAAAVGLALVFLYTVFYYRALGIVVLVGLATTAALLWAIISYLGTSQGLALTLSGITGLIVSVGVVTDSYIVFFERLKDEVRAGKSVRASVDRGFTAAFRTIIAADLVSLIGAVVLYFLSIGDVKNFAFYLGLSTLLDMATAWTFTRPFVILLGR